MNKKSLMGLLQDQFLQKMQNAFNNPGPQQAFDPYAQKEAPAAAPAEEAPAKEETAAAVDGVKCSNCGAVVTGKFCTECGTAVAPVEEAPATEEAGPKKCPNCGAEVTGKFCTECGTKVEE